MTCDSLRRVKDSSIDSLEFFTASAAISLSILLTDIPSCHTAARNLDQSGYLTWGFESIDYIYCGVIGLKGLVQSLYVNDRLTRAFIVRSY